MKRDVFATQQTQQPRLNLQFHSLQSLPRLSSHTSARLLIISTQMHASQLQAGRGPSSNSHSISLTLAPQFGLEDAYTLERHLLAALLPPGMAFAHGGVPSRGRGFLIVLLSPHRSTSGMQRVSLCLDSSCFHWWPSFRRCIEEDHNRTVRDARSGQLALGATRCSFGQHQQRSSHILTNESCLGS